MPENLLESELFGHERGAFTGAVRDKKGLFQEADRGTLFLDEIGEMTPAMQVKLLRALQEKVVRKVGGNAEEPVDVRIIAATNQDLEERIAARRVPRGPLLPDQRHPDPPAAAARSGARTSRCWSTSSCDKYSRQMELRRAKRISVEAMRLLEGYDWPGNVRELENLIERALALSPGETITAARPAGPPARPRRREPAPSGIALPDEGLDLEAYLEEIRTRAHAPGARAHRRRPDPGRRAAAG